MFKLLRNKTNNNGLLFGSKRKIYIFDRRVVKNVVGSRAVMVLMRTKCDIKSTEPHVEYVKRSFNELLGGFTDEQRKQSWYIFKIVPSVFEKCGETPEGQNIYKLKDESINMTHILGAIGNIEKHEIGLKLNIKLGFGKITRGISNKGEKPKDALEIYGEEQVVIKAQDYEVPAGFETEKR